LVLRIHAFHFVYAEHFTVLIVVLLVVVCLVSDGRDVGAALSVGSSRDGNPCRRACALHLPPKAFREPSLLVCDNCARLLGPVRSRRGAKSAHRFRPHFYAIQRTTQHCYQELAYVLHHGSLVVSGLTYDASAGTYGGGAFRGHRAVSTDSGLVETRTSLDIERRKTVPPTLSLRLSAWLL
jgi:hypothetical protein